MTLNEPIKWDGFDSLWSLTAYQLLESSELSDVIQLFSFFYLFIQ